MAPRRTKPGNGRKEMTVEEARTRRPNRTENFVILNMMLLPVLLTFEHT